MRGCLLFKNYLISLIENFCNDEKGTPQYQWHF
jgi:hypothetical protein